jgi:6-phosphogluconate dehydrogenase
MELGMIGLGRMGANMVERLMKAGHLCVVYDSPDAAVQQSVTKGARGTTQLPDFVSALSKPRAVWRMLPAAAVDPVHTLVSLLEPGDIVIDGGNSYYHDDIRRARELHDSGLHYVDVGVSGGVWGLERGYCHIIGGEDAIVRHLDPIFRSLANSASCSPPAACGRNSASARPSVDAPDKPNSPRHTRSPCSRWPPTGSRTRSPNWPAPNAGSPTSLGFLTPPA